jgi:hypothetical protein
MEYDYLEDLAELEPDLEMARRFLKTLDPNAANFTFQTFDDNYDRKAVNLPRIYNCSLDECYENLKQLNRQGAGVYVTVNATNLRGRKKEDIDRVRAIWHEDDDGVNASFPVDPNIVVDSSPGKFHRYFLTHCLTANDQLAKNEFDTVQQVLVDKYGSDPKAADISRVLRLPGFYHTKYSVKKGLFGKPHLVELLYTGGTFTEWAALKNAFGVSAVEVANARPVVGVSSNNATTFLDEEQLRELRSALMYLPADDERLWKLVGMALKSIGAAGLELWRFWARTSSKFDPASDKEMLKRWPGFKVGASEDGLSYTAIFQWAQERGWINPASNEAQSIRNLQPANDAEIWQEPEREEIPKPGDFEPLPGKLLPFLEEWFVNSAYKTNRDLAQMAVLALISTVAGRMYVSSTGSYTSCQFVGVAPTGSGKDFTRKGTHKILVEAGLDKLAGPASVTSEAAVRAQLLAHPTRLFVFDEFGDKLKRAVVSRDQNERAAFDSFKECYSSADSVWRQRGYAAGNLTHEQLKKAEERNINNPSLTMMGLTTPEQLAGALTEDLFEGGFINRFMVINANKSRNVRHRRLNFDAPSEAIVERIKSIRNIDDPLRKAGFNNSDMIPNPFVVPVDEAAIDAMQDFWDENESKYEKHPFMAQLTARLHENAMRIATAIAVFENPREARVTLELYEWATRCVERHSQGFADMCEKYVHGSEFAKQKVVVLEYLRRAGVKGLSLREMNRIKPIQKLKPKERDEVLGHLAELGLALAKIAKPEGQGRPMQRWYAIK